MSALASARTALSIVACIKGQARYISQIVVQLVRSRYLTSASAVPNPYQAGIMQRFCVQEKTQGMARKSANVRSPRRRDGRDPIGRFSISSMGVADAKNWM